MHHVAAKVQAQPIVVQGNVRAVAGVTGILEAGIVFFFLDFQELAIKRSWAIRRMTFIINTRIEHEVNGIRITAQVNASIDSRPNGIAKSFAAAVIHATYQRHRQSHAGLRFFKSTMSRNRRPVFVIEVKQCVLFCRHKVLAERGIAMRVSKELTPFPCCHTMQFKKHRRIFKQAQVANILGAHHRRCSEGRHRKHGCHQKGKRLRQGYFHNVSIFQESKGRNLFQKDSFLFVVNNATGAFWSDLFRTGKIVPNYVFCFFY